MKTYPTTLHQLAPQGGVVHAYAEFNGTRYYIGAGVRFYEAEEIARQYKAQYPKACMFVTDRSDSTSIYGGPLEFANAYGQGV